MPLKERLKVGEGQISGYIATFLATLSLLGIFCFMYPERLTTPEFRNIYTKESMQALMAVGVIASFFFALVSVILSKKIKWAWPGVLIAGVAIMLGAFTVQGRAVKSASWHIGLDWMLLDLLLMTIIFIPLELFFPKNDKQSKFHEEWRTDLVYFIISHLAIQFFGIVSQKPAVVFFGWMGLDKVHAWGTGTTLYSGVIFGIFRNRPFPVLGAPFSIPAFRFGAFILYTIPHKVWIGWPAAVRILSTYFLPVL